MKNAKTLISKPADKAVVELLPANLEQVAGGLNPQPLPPRVEERV